MWIIFTIIILFSVFLIILSVKEVSSYPNIAPVSPFTEISEKPLAYPSSYLKHFILKLYFSYYHNTLAPKNEREFPYTKLVEKGPDFIKYTVFMAHEKVAESFREQYKYPKKNIVVTLPTDFTISQVGVYTHGISGCTSYIFVNAKKDKYIALHSGLYEDQTLFIREKVLPIIEIDTWDLIVVYQVKRVGGSIIPKYIADEEFFEFLSYNRHRFDIKKIYYIPYVIGLNHILVKRNKVYANVDRRWFSFKI